MLRRILLAVALPPATIALLYAGYCGLLIWSGNVHTVKEGQLYRSAELSEAGFAEEIETHHIRTVLNLRGANPGKGWYRGEVSSTQAHGAKRFDIAISARSKVPEDKVAEILAVLRDAPRPILVHCASGSDRTGFVSALFLYAVLGETAEEAGRELSLWYGHFPFLGSRTHAMDDSLASYVVGHAPVMTAR